MKTRLHLLAISVALFCAANVSYAIDPPKIPLPPPIHEEPNLLSDYERRTLSLEMSRLRKEIITARQEAAQDPSLDEAKQVLAEAIDAKDKEQIKAARQYLSDMTEIVLYAQEGIPRKIKRLLDVGRMLEYDTQHQKDLRRRQGTAF